MRSKVEILEEQKGNASMSSRRNKPIIPLAVVTTFAWLGVHPANAQDISNPPSIGIAPKVDAKPKKNYTKGTGGSWHQSIGKKFIFLRRSQLGDDNTSSSCNYLDWSIADARGNDPNDFIVPGDAYGFIPTSLIYSKFVGKVITCLGFNNSGHILFYVPQYGIDIQATLSDGHIDGIAPLTELDEAKSLWLRKTVYPIDTTLYRYNSATRQSDVLNIDKDEPLRIVDAIWGDDDSAPVWLIVENKGKPIGYYAIGVDKMNKQLNGPYSMTPASKEFTTKTPAMQNKELKRQRAIHHWSDEAWQAIDAGEVNIGMTYEQVRMSIGKPEKVNEDIYTDGIHQQWIYDEKFVYFENGRCSAIQNRP